MIRTALLGIAFAAVGSLGAFSGIILKLLRACRLVSRRDALVLGAGIWRIVARAVLAVAGVRIDGPGLPVRSLIVANHRSWLDPLVFAQMSTCTFVAKSEIRRWPVGGLLMRTLPIVSIEKNEPAQLSRMVSQTASFLEQGLSVVAFPEGTTTPEGTIRAFSPAVFQAAIDTGRSVVAVSVSYRPLGKPGEDISWRSESLWQNCLRLAAQRGRIVSQVRLVLHLKPPFAVERKVLAHQCCQAIAGDLRAEVVSQPRTFEEFCSLLSAHLGAGPLSSDTRLDRLEWDSLQLVQIAMDLEGRGIAVQPDDLFTSRTMGELHERLLTRHGPVDAGTGMPGLVESPVCVGRSQR